MTDTPATRTPLDVLAGYTVVDSDLLVSRIINAPVYDSEAADAQQLGTINDLILSQSGDVAAVVIGVGGFLGLGEKQVAVDFTALQKVVASDNTERFVLATTVENLTNAPDYQVVDDASPDTDATTSDPAAASSAMSSAQ
ncbi:MAG: PRC-barrel domain-containing protein [Devosia sp.]